jgi:hypothetical protein
MLQVYKAMKTGNTLYLCTNFHTDPPYPTRQATDGGLRYLAANTGRQSTTQNSFFVFAQRLYNSIPAEIRADAALPTFKMKNVPIE